MTQTAANQTPDLLVVLQALGQIFLNYGVPLLVVVGLWVSYRALVARIDRDTEVRALQAVARRRVERRKNAAARNLELRTGREVARRR